MSRLKSVSLTEERLCQVDGCGKPHQWFTDPGLYLCDEHSERWIEKFPVHVAEAAAPSPDPLGEVHPVGCTCHLAP